mmetsp:Transcript_4398/g.7486  ORF Transcript_4398/g.7486 Transcript_4398/m.7486 type:complete len:110 (-) Transcript_4398:269-598(-)|eukprot:CAMPEP_0198196758 /NCGR_PEP_ID=MMETSP1445-20131203/150_1 /TAXON_ID=36898 /ORGANISM="Pyramimonas sp., Strain CCMP2087" /LENGTH=109 /DNA_ID=CAMNT_0043865721 /DNA_START=85 /DNA_END=414 /DNA_ORIENTATION=+
MKVVCAYLLAVLGGNESPSKADIKTLLGSVGVEAEDSNIDKLLSELEGKDLAEIIAAGSLKLATVPSGGGGGGGPAVAGGAAAGSVNAPKAPEPEPEEEEEDMGFDLFD